MANPWKIIIVDDEIGIHEMTKLALSGLTFQQKNVTFLSAYSIQDAKHLIKTHPDIAVMFLDSNIDKNYSGLEVVDYIRKELNNHLVQIVIRSEQSQITREKVMNLKYDIDDYKIQTQLIIEKLSNVTLQALKIYQKQAIQEQNRIEKKIGYIIPSNFLTNLPNRSLFINRLKQQITRAQQQKIAQFAVLLVDCERFKIISESLGQKTVNKLLCYMAELLQQQLRSDDFLAWLGFDKFAILIENPQSLKEVITIAENINQQIRLPFHINNSKIFISASIGIVMTTGEYQHPEDILQDAKTALYQAKTHGKEGYQVFSKQEVIESKI